MFNEYIKSVEQKAKGEIMNNEEDIKNLYEYISETRKSEEDLYKQYGIEYKNPGNLFAPIYITDVDKSEDTGRFEARLAGTGEVIKIFRYVLCEDLEKSKELKEAFNNYNDLLFATYRNKMDLQIFGFGPSDLYLMFNLDIQLDKLAKKLDKLSKKNNVKYFTLGEKLDYIDNYKKAKQKELNEKRHAEEMGM